MIKSHLCDQEIIVHWVKQSLWPRKTSNSNWLTTGYIGGSLQWMNNPLFRGAVHSASANVSQDYKTWFRQTGSLQCTQSSLLTMNMIFVQYQPHLLDTDRSTVLIGTQAPGLAKDLLTFGKYLGCCHWTLMADLEAWAPSHSKHLIVFWKYQARQTQYISTSCSFCCTFVNPLHMNTWKIPGIRFLWQVAVGLCRKIHLSAWLTDLYGRLPLFPVDSGDV